MINFNFKNIQITGIAAAVPSKVIDVEEFAPVFGSEAVRKFKKMTGVEQMHWAAKDQTSSDFGYVAANELMLKKEIDRATIGALIFVSQTPDYKIPATACVLHKRLGLTKNCLAFDINLGCSGYIYGLQTVCSLLQTSNIDRALLIVGDTLSKNVSPEDRSATMLFGDAGAATLLEKVDVDTNIYASLRTKGDDYKAIIVQGGGYRNPLATNERTIRRDGNTRSDCDLYMNGTDVFNFTISEVPSLINDFMSYHGTTPNDYDSLVMHQANYFILKQVAKKTKFPIEKLPISIDKFGNTSVASIPLTLSKIFGSENENQEIKALMSGFGVGLSWGVLSATLNTIDILPIIITDEYFAEGGDRCD